MANDDKQFDFTTLPEGAPGFRALMDNPAFMSMFSFLKRGEEEKAKGARDSSRIFRENKLFDSNDFSHYPNSPTASYFRRAVYHFRMAVEIIKGYNRESVDNLKDCEVLRPAFENVVYGHICENSMYEPFRPPDNTSILIDQYLMLKPDDVFAEYAKHIILGRTLLKEEKGNNLLSDFESSKLYIKSSELLALKLKPKTNAQPYRMILIDIYYYLGSKYVSTEQHERALDSFQKCFDLDNSNYRALYGIAYQHMESDPEKALELFKKFISMAPECEKQYPNAYYMIATIYMSKGNFDAALRHCSLAEDAERTRLPFLGPVDIPHKDMMQQMKCMIPQIQKLRVNKK